MGIGRPGCIVYKGACMVLDESRETWQLAPVKPCKTCGVDQHLDECLDCLAPVGVGDKQKAVRPLKPCSGCGGWSPGGQKCYGCIG